MSLETWVREFYSIAAQDTKPEEALDHSILKWQGLQTAMLDKHGVNVVPGEFMLEDADDPDEQNFYIVSATCALCAHFYYNVENEEDEKERCQTCPLAQARNGVPCDKTRDDEQHSPYDLWATHPEVMLNWLLKAKERGAE